MTSPPLIDPWQELVDHCVPEVFSAPKTWGDPLRPPSMDVPRGLESNVAYLKRNVVGHLWVNHMVLLVSVLFSHNLQYKTVLEHLGVIHRGLANLFAAFHLQTMMDWNVDIHLTLYLKGEVLEAHSSHQRLAFWKSYLGVARHLRRWVTGLPEELQERYRPYLLPFPHDPVELAQWSGHARIEQEQQEKRKAETDAIMPFYMDLRTQSHLRYNLLLRLRKAYHKAIKTVEQGKAVLPFVFEMREGGSERKNLPPTERLVFKLWDRRTFVVEHSKRDPTLFGKLIKWHARSGRKGYTDERNSYLLEFVQAESLDGTSPVSGLWFSDLLEQDVLGDLAGTPEEVEVKQAWLRKHGYLEDDQDQANPFKARTSGVLYPAKTSGDGKVMRDFHKRTGAILVPVEPFYVAVTFGMVALHILTANGMRIAELQQLRASSECIVPLVLHPAPEAHNQTPTVHWEARVVPKGHRTPKPYYFDDEHLRLLSLVKFMLCEHYSIDLKTGGDLPVVSLQDKDKYRFKADRYLFQYDHHALLGDDIRTCMRFMVHGLVFQTVDGRKITIKPHLLRHGFATWALNVAKEPVDIVAAILNQKNLAITKYYGRPNQRLIVERSHGLMNQISSYIDVDEAILRSPEEIKQLLLKAQQTHGTLARVRGGQCLVSGECPILFACIGCAAKAPNPAQREEVEETRQITLIQIQRAKKKGLGLEVIQLEKKLKQCLAELREMDMIEACREDENREPEVNFDIDA